jgi:hypothetical protein
VPVHNIRVILIIWRSWVRNPPPVYSFFNST